MSERASDRIARQLRRLIITGQIPQGSMQTEAQLMDMLDCGRTPLREALQQLSYVYLVKILPRRGILIPELSIVDFKQSHEVVLDMGCVHIERAIVRISERQLALMKDIVAQQERADQAANFYDAAELDCQFHTLIAEATGIRYHADSAHRLHSSLARFTYAAYGALGTASRSIGEHQQIVNALEMRDAELAKQKLHEHISSGREWILNVLGLGTEAEW